MILEKAPPIAAPAQPCAATPPLCQVRTQYYRAAWQSDSSAAVRISLDEALFMLNENPKRESRSTLETGRWFRDPYAPVAPDEVTWFPHGVIRTGWLLCH